MLAYSHPIVTRDAFLTELQRHADADQIVKGQYWEGGRGCAVGCSLNSISWLLVDGSVPRDDHEMLAKILGVPPQLTYFEDTIFEGLPVDLALQWPMRFASAIQQDANLSNVWPQFTVWMLREIALPAARGRPACEAAIERVARGYETRWQSDTAAAAAFAATYAANASDAAYHAGATAATAAAAAAAANAAARSAGAAAANAAAAATAAADAAARSASAVYTKMANKLVELIAAAPIGEAS
jgi:hypothetical protein